MLSKAFTTVSVEAGVDWGAEALPSRMLELEAYHKRLLCMSHSGELDIHKIKAYHDWICGLGNTIQHEGESMTRKIKLAHAKFGKTSDVRLNNALSVQIDAIRRQEDRHNREVSMVKHEIAWLKRQPAWKAAMRFMAEHWQYTPHGWVSKKDMADDAEMDFTSLLSAMKDEDCDTSI